MLMRHSINPSADLRCHVQYVCSLFTSVLAGVQVKMLHALSASGKSDLLALMFGIEKTFSPFWDDYTPYKELQRRIKTLRDVIDETPENEAQGMYSQIT
jgi:hypothetical protein